MAEVSRKGAEHNRLRTLTALLASSRAEPIFRWSEGSPSPENLFIARSLVPLEKTRAFGMTPSSESLA